MSNNTILHAKNIYKSFKKISGPTNLVLENVSLQIQEREIVALLGKSGSGKSTLLRIISGLIKPSKGEVMFKNKKFSAPIQEIAMIFQSFALFPWLTVLDNVELGLESLQLSKNVKKERALKAIDIIGLDGFESAYPKELSGGMRQRVGIARALVMEPELLLMDEAFSALDVLTAENLRTDLLDLWLEKQTKIKSIIQITHSIEEAVMMADRVLIFDNNPGKIKKEIFIDIPHLRNLQDERVRKLIDDIYQIMTTKERLSTTQIQAKTQNLATKLEIQYRLPEAEVSEIIGLIETISLPENAQSQDISTLAESLRLDIDSLFPLLEMLETLNFANINQGNIVPTKQGLYFAEADILEKKQIFANHLLKHVALAKYIVDVLMKDADQRVDQEVFLALLEEKLSESEANRVLKTIIDWGRYAEIFAYDYDSGELSLENPN